MQNDSAVTTPNYVELTSDVVSAYVSNNSVSRADLPALIGSVHAALSVASAPVAAKELTPPIPINFYIVSLEDGRQYRSLKRAISRPAASPRSSTGRNGVFVLTIQWSRRATRRRVQSSLGRWALARKAGKKG